MSVMHIRLEVLGPVDVQDEPAESQQPKTGVLTQSAAPPPKPPAPAPAPAPVVDLLDMTSDIPSPQVGVMKH